MEDINKEKYIEKYPSPVTFEKTLKILNQMQYCICKIFQYGGEGSGFLCNINYKNINIKALITCNHILDEKYFQNYKKVFFCLYDKKKISLSIDNDRMLYFNKDLDITIIEIKNNDNITHFLDLDSDCLEEEGSIMFERKSIYNISYPKDKDVSVSYGMINKINNSEIYHLCCTEKGSSGSPLINLRNNNVFGIHVGSSEKFNLNKGTFLKVPILEFINKKKNNFSCKININNNFTFRTFHSNEIDLNIDYYNTFKSLKNSKSFKNFNSNEIKKINYNKENKNYLISSYSNNKSQVKIVKNKKNFIFKKIKKFNNTKKSNFLKENYIIF